MMIICIGCLVYSVNMIEYLIQKQRKKLQEKLKETW